VVEDFFVVINDGMIGVADSDEGPGVVWVVEHEIE